MSLYRFLELSPSVHCHLFIDLSSCTMMWHTIVCTLYTVLPGLLYIVLGMSYQTLPEKVHMDRTSGGDCRKKVHILVGR